MADTHLSDLPLSQVQQIAKALGVRGWDMPDRTYLVKCIQAKRLADAKAYAQAVADAAMKEALAADMASAESVSEYEAMDKADLQKLADERGLDVTGTGKGGTVLKSDLVTALSA